jgi:hypothetical protein
MGARGLLLWFVVPVAVVCWLPLALVLRRRTVTFGRFLGWVDLNLIALLERTILRPTRRTPTRWIPFKAIPEVTSSRPRRSLVAPGVSAARSRPTVEEAVTRRSE